MRKTILTLASAAALAAMPGLAQQQQQQPQPQAQATTPKPKSKGEQDALQKVQAASQANDPQATLAAISNVLENYADTDYKPMLLDIAIQAAQQTNDPTTTVTWCERAVLLEPNNIVARATLADTIASGMHQNDLDKAQNTEKVKKNANEAIDMLKKAESAPPGFPAAQWPSYKAHLTEESYDALGLVADVNKDYPEAVKQFEAAAAAEPTNPLPQARLSKVYTENKQYDQAIAAADKVLASSDALPPVKNFAQSQKNFAEKMKAAGSK